MNEEFFLKFPAKNEGTKSVKIDKYVYPPPPRKGRGGKISAQVNWGGGDVTRGNRIKRNM
jgi:hypothetical protein